MEDYKANKFSFFNSRKKRIFPAVSISVSLPFLLFIAVPYDIFCNNIAEFEFSVSNFALYSFLFFLGFAIINFIILYFTPRIVYRIFSAFFIAFLIMSFLQMTLLNGSLTTLKGDDLGESFSNSTVIFNAIFWIVVTLLLIAGFICIPKKNFLRTFTLIVAIILFITQFVNIVTLSYQTKGANGTSLSRILEKDPDFVPTFLTTKDMTTLSKNKNVFVFCVDRMDGMDFLEPALKNHPEYFNELEGFTYFTDNTSMYGHTYPSVSYMITGNEFDGSLREDYFNFAYNQNKTISRLNDEGYMINIYTDSYYGYYNAYYLPDYINNKETASLESISFVNNTAPYILALRMAQIGFYRCLPYALKDLVGNVSSSALNSEVIYSSEELSNPESSIDMKFIFDNVKKKDFSLTEQNVYSFIHLSGCHSIDYDTNWNKTSKIKDINVSIDNSFKIINEYIKAMKEFGVYDEATIIITADHGNCTAASDLTALKNQRLAALFVKPSKSSRELDYPKKIDYSSAYVSHEDLWATIFNSEGLNKYDDFGKSVFYYKDNEDLSKERVRKFVWHTWNLTASSSTEYLYSILGSARDFKNWTVVNKKIFDRYLLD